MVTYKEIQASNALINDATAPRVSVFVGGTSGIGKITLKALVETGASMRIYLVGRKSSQERTNIFIQELHAINPKAEILWTEGEISLLADTKRICEIIKGKEPRIDLLFLTAGYAPMSTRKETSEDIEIVQSLENYSRMVFIHLLLPNLKAAENPRIVSVLSGGLMIPGFDLNLDDIDLKKPGNFTFLKAQTQYGMLHTVALDKLASDNPRVTFIHSGPGSVNTGNVRRGLDSESWFMAWFVTLVLEPLISLFSYSDEESGQRHLFQCTSAAFGGHGVPWAGKRGINALDTEAGGMFLVNSKCDCTPNPKKMSLLREKAQQKVWAHTEEVLKPYLC